MRTTKSLAGVVTSVLVVGVAAGCGGTSGSAGQGQSGSSNARVSEVGGKSGADVLPQPEQKDLTFGISANDPHQFALQFAADLGLFKEYGFTSVNGRFFGKSSTTQKALISNQVDVITNNATQAVLSATTSRPTQDVGVMIDKLPDVLYGAKGITSAQDVRGKKVAEHGPGGQSYAEAVAGVKELGLSPSEVQFTTVGGQTARLAALKAGTVAAAPADRGLTDKLSKVGISPLVNLAKSDYRLPGSDIQFTKEFIRKYPKTVLDVTAAVLKAVQLEFTDTPKAVKAYAKWAQIDPSESKSVWHDYLNSGIASRNLRSNIKAYKNAKQVLTPIKPSVSKVDVTKVYNDSFLNKLKKLGFNKAINVPKHK